MANRTCAGPQQELPLRDTSSDEVGASGDDLPWEGHGVCIGQCGSQLSRMQPGTVVYAPPAPRTHTVSGVFVEDGVASSD
jgi:hypothetical protein